MKIIGVIPARLASQRLPRKVLREIGGKLLIEWVYEGARHFSRLDELWVAVDSGEVLEACRQRNIPALLTSPHHLSGTDRLYEVMQKKPADVYVNIQGDEPLVRVEHLKALIEPFLSRPQTKVSTLKVKISKEAAQNPNTVKVVSDAGGNALYFSRSPLPFDRDGTGEVSYDKHLGLYAYSAEALNKFHDLAPSSLEKAEKLEQLRLLENGVPIFVAETSFDTVSVDTEEDLKRVEAILKSSVSVK